MRLKNTATQHGITKRLVLGFAALATTAIVGTAGMASAHSMPGHHDQGHGWGQGHGGGHDHDKDHNHGHGQGSGYGGGNTNTVNSDVNVNVNGHHNVVYVVINYIFN